MYEDLLYGFYSLVFKFSGKVLPVILILLFLFCFVFFLVILFRVGSFIRSLTFGSSFSLTWNLGSLLDLRLVSQCWITDGHKICPPIEGLLPPTGTEPAPFRNSTSKVAGF